MYPLGTWYVSGICVWLPCIKETTTMTTMVMVMMMMMMIIIIIILQCRICTEYYSSNTNVSLNTQLQNW